MKTVFCSELDDHGFDWVADKIKSRVGTGPVYLSLDIDVADPAFAPGTGTPEVWCLLRFLLEVFVTPVTIICGSAYRVFYMNRLVL